MTTRFQTQQEIQAINDFGQEFCDQIFTATLAQNTDTTVNVPGAGLIGGLPAYENNQYRAVIRVSNAKDVWIAKNTTAAVPAGATFAASDSELISGGQDFSKTCQNGDVLHFFTASTGVSVSIAFYALPA
jgi:hypothetical protein